MRFTLVKLAAIVLLFAVSLGGTRADEAQETLKLVERMLDDGKTVEAVELLRPLAESGVPLAQHYLGLALQLGPIEIRNPSEALRLWTLAAKSGLDEAQFRLGIVYTMGDGVPKDTIAGLAWFIVAGAEEGMAYHLVASAASSAEIEDAHRRATDLRSEIAKHQVELVVVQEPEARAGQLLVLAEAGNAEAQYELGWMRLSGASTDEPNDEAFRWFQQAAASGHLGAMYQVAVSLERSDPWKAVAWYEKVMSQGGTYNAMLRLSRMLLVGRGTARDIDRANRLLLRVAKSGDPELQAEVANIYADVSTGDLRQAYMWYLIAERTARDDELYAFDFPYYLDELAMRQGALVDLMPSQAVDEARAMAARCWTSRLTYCAPPNLLEQFLAIIGVR